MDFMMILAQAATEAASSSLIGDKGLAVLGLALGFGFTIMGAAKGIGNIGGKAVESMARQPEVAGPVGTNMIISAALIEGIAVISMVLLFVISLFL